MIKYFDSLNEFFNKEDRDVISGDYVQTYGYNAINDGGSGLYKVKSVSATVSNAITFNGLEVTCKGCTLELIPENGTVRVEQFGAVGNYSFENMTATEKTAFYTKNKNAVQAAIDSGVSSVEFADKTYMVDGNITISDSVNVIGNSAVLQLGESCDTIIKLYKADSYVENVNIYDITLKGKDVNSDCTLLLGENVAKTNVDNVRFETGNCAISITTGYENSNEINIRNCNAINVITGFVLDNVIDFKINNCRIELADSDGSEDSKGLYFNQKTSFGVVEDVSIYNAYYAIYYEGDSEAWDGIAIERILFKNLLIDECDYGISTSYNEIPLHFSNAMLVDVDYGFNLECTKNIEVINSSVLIKSPADAAANAAPVCVNTYAKAKFIHTQFDFPHSFSKLTTYDVGETCELSYADCTMQKTDIAGVTGVVEPTGFGYITDTHSLAAKLIETFDACEFRSYIKDYKLTTGEGENAVTTYNLPIEIFSPFDSGSKLIFKNSRFINDTTCDIPYFCIFNGNCPDNIVVYNCFFENYEYSTGEGENKEYPIFGKVSNSVLSLDVSNFNIFAKCNMRSSKPIRNTGTTINEMVTYE